MRIIFLFSIICLACGAFAQKGGNQKIIDSLEQVLQTAHADTMRIKVLNNLCWEYRNSDQKKAEAYGLKGAELAARTGDKKGLAGSFSNLGVVYEKLGNYSGSRDYHFKALKIRRELGDSAGIAKIYTNIGITYQKQGDYLLSLQYHIRSMKIKESLGDQGGAANNLLNIANIYFNQEKYQEALDTYFKVLKIKEGTSDEITLSYCYGNIAAVYHATYNFPLSLENSLKSLELKKKTGDRIGTNNSLITIGVCYREMNDPIRALNYFKEARIGFEELAHKEGLALALHHLASAYSKMGNYSEAVRNYERSADLSEEIGDKQRLKEAWYGLSETYARQKQFGKAYAYLEKFRVLKDSLINFENNRQMAEMNARYETEKKDKELLKKDVEITQQKAALQQQEEKGKRLRLIFSGIFLVVLLVTIAAVVYVRQRRAHEKIMIEKQLSELEHQALRLQMNPHFIFNSLSSIGNFIGKNDPVEAKKFLSKFAKLMRLILENSREQFVPLEKEIETLQHYLELEQLRFPGRFNYTIRTSDGMEASAISIPPMLVQPHVENAILHGFGPAKTNGHITIMFNRSGTRLTCMVEDDGIGREKAAELKGEADHRSMAINVTRERLRMFSSNRDVYTLEVEDLHDTGGPGAGTRVTFTLPFQDLSLA